VPPVGGLGDPQFGSAGRRPGDGRDLPLADRVSAVPLGAGRGTARSAGRGPGERADRGRGGGDRLNHEELISTILLLFTAGHETTTNLFGNGMLALLRNPDQMRRLKDQPELLRPRIEELLRYDSPVQFVIRIAKSPITVRGVDLARGDSLLLVIAAANRDPEQFADPDVLDIGRKDLKHLLSGAEFTSVSGRRWLASRPRSRSGPCSPHSRRSSLQPTTFSGARTSI
jgi:hypothetical protein